MQIILIITRKIYSAESLVETNRTTIISKPGNKLPNYHSNILTELNKSKMKNHTNIINQVSYKATALVVANTNNMVKC